MHSGPPDGSSTGSRPAGLAAALVVAAGSSRRMGFDKLAAPLAGAPVLRRTLEAFIAAETIGRLVVVCPPEREALWDCLATHKPIVRVDGGATRQESVAAGLAALGSDAFRVAVHDGARPLVSPADIDRVLTAAASEPAVALARRATETMKRSDQDGYSLEALSRENLWCMETPQVFDPELLRRACAEAAVRGISVTDEVSAVELLGVRTRFLEALHPNPKITTPADLALAVALWKLRA